MCSFQPNDAKIKSVNLICIVNKINTISTFNFLMYKQYIYIFEIKRIYDILDNWFDDYLIALHKIEKITIWFCVIIYEIKKITPNPIYNLLL